MFMRIEISRILHNSFAIAWGNSGSHNFSVNTDYQLIYIKRTLYNTTVILYIKAVGPHSQGVFIYMNNMYHLQITDSH